MKHLFAVTSLALLLTSCTNSTNATQKSAPSQSFPPKSSPSSVIEVVGGNEESLREFISRWLTPFYPSETSQNITIYIGSLPKDIPFDLPMPSDTRIIGSVTGYGGVDYLLILDIGLSTEAAQNFYAQSVIGRGWRKAPSPQNQGFISQPVSYKGYCYGDNEAFLSVEALPLPDGNTNLHLSLDTSPESYMCQGDASSYGPPHADLMPVLQAPEGVFVQGGSSGGGDSDAEISANLKTKLSAAELAKYYNEQLQTAGWEIQNSGDGEGAAWSTWTFKDQQGKTWSGTLIVIGTTSSNDSRYALLRIEKNP